MGEEEHGRESPAAETQEVEVVLDRPQTGKRLKAQDGHSLVVDEEKQAEEEKQAAIVDLQLLAGEEEEGDGIDDVLRQRADDVFELNRCGYYSNHPNPKSKAQVAEVIIATKFGLRQQFDQVNYQNKVFGLYNKWRKTGFKAEDVNSALDEALVVKRKVKAQKTILHFFSPGAKPAAQLSPLLFTKKTTTDKAARSGKGKRRLEVKEAALIENADKPTVVKLALAVGSSELPLSHEELCELKVLAQAALSNVVNYQEKRAIFEGMKSYMLDSQFAADLASAEQVCADLKLLLDKGEDLRRELNEALPLASTFEKEKLVKEGKAKVDAVTEQLKIQLLQSSKIFERAIQILKRRIYEKERTAKGLNKREIVLLEENTSRTWEECLDSIVGQKQAFGCSMWEEDFEKVAEYAELTAKEGRTHIFTEELVTYLGKEPSEAKGLQRLVTQNLPMIHYSSNLPGVDARLEEILCDARAILTQPRLLVSLYQDLAHEPGVEESEPPAKIPRKKGSGRPKDARYFIHFCIAVDFSPNIFRDREGTARARFSAEQIKKVESFIQHCGLPAHARRREDVASFGGQGAGECCTCTCSKCKGDLVTNFFCNSCNVLYIS